MFNYKDFGYAYIVELKWFDVNGYIYIDMVFPDRMDITVTPTPDLFNVVTNNGSGSPDGATWNDDHTLRLNTPYSSPSSIVALDYLGPSKLLKFKNGKQWEKFVSAWVRAA